MRETFDRGIKVNCRVRNLQNLPKENRQPYSHEELRSMGFDGYLSDYVTGPEELIVTACRKRGLDVTVWVLLTCLCSDAYS
jgi:hypothetical protein